MLGINKEKTAILRTLRVPFFLLCLGGWLYQTSQFLCLYWTYPTVVDIQQIEPSYLEMPAISICNSVGYNFEEFCHGFNSTPCVGSEHNRIINAQTCHMHPYNCFDGKLPEDFKYDCEGNRVFRKECSTIDVYILFDRYEITNLTYNPKFESLEFFSAIGGYIGMWLGVSIPAVYDFVGSIFLMVSAHRKNGEKTKLHKIKRNKCHKRSKLSHHGRWLSRISKS